MEMRKVVLDENVIPPMTHPWGKAWKQPDRNNLVLDDKYVMMYRRDLRCCRIIQVRNRPASINGKMWKAQYVSQ